MNANSEICSKVLGMILNESSNECSIGMEIKYDKYDEYPLTLPAKLGCTTSRAAMHTTTS